MAEPGIYDGLSLDELRALSAAMNREADPERAAEIDAAIARKEAAVDDGDTVSEINTDGSGLPSEAMRAASVVEDRLASRGERFAAALIDAVVSILITIPLFFVVGLENLQEPSIGLTAMIFVYGFASFLLVHGFILFNYGQTVGKRFLKIRIEDLEDNQATFSTIMLKRYLPISIVAYIPVVGSILSLIDVLFIFRADKRCVHDLIADTRVCRVPEGFNV
ncbi:RDD family protein [Aestuariibacter sp. A3R04]|uniref:RDD family protein n=1 Tax=Aestuariibacter sp. A3R04 TaxID=2841571 RepID=UPI001C09ECA2|nr:RDD family protein [Aestuariibacter sp. A3R04]MBU3020605.1 RDD family protein [Aestuariibacter sp. A3R04]